MLRVNAYRVSPDLCEICKKYSKQENKGIKAAAESFPPFQLIDRWQNVATIQRLKQKNELLVTIHGNGSLDIARDTHSYPFFIPHFVC